MRIRGRLVFCCHVCAYRNTKPSKKKKKKPIPSKKCLPSRSQLKWRRELLDDESSSTTPSTSAESRHSANPPALSPSPSAGTTASRKLRPSSGNVYKWKRRSSSGIAIVLSLVWLPFNLSVLTINF